MAEVHKVSRRELLSISGLAVAGFTVASCVPITAQPAAPTAEPAVTNADEAL